MSVDIEDTTLLVGSCAWPAEAYWRVLELDALRSCTDEFRAPVLELGCGDGQFTELVGISVAVGTDLEPRAIERAARRGGYERTFRLDVHELPDVAGAPFGTIYANSVLEHVVKLEEALPGIRATLTPGGKLITTVPLEPMNDHLLSGNTSYVRWRQRLLAHRNLWSKAQWERRLLAAGFTDVSWVDYLPGEACARWDRADVIGTLGTGRYRVAPVAHRLVSLLLPSPLKHQIKHRIAAAVLARARRDAGSASCAAVLIATA